MKVKLEWSKPLMEWDKTLCKEIPSKLDREKIYLTVGISGLNEKRSYEFLNDLEEKINKELGDKYGTAVFARCSGYGDVKDAALYDELGWKRNFGVVSEQKKEILQAIRRICKSMKTDWENEKKQDRQIVFDERYDSEEYDTTTLYFIASKEMLKDLVANDYPEAVSMEISIEFPTEHMEAAYASVCVSPTNAEGEDYDWCDVDMPYDEIEKLIVIAESKQ